MYGHPTLAVATLGCRTNQAEAAQWVAELADVCALVPFEHGADVVLVNTCTVTHEADRQSRQLVRRAHRLNPQARIVVTGCAVVRDAAPYGDIPGVERVVANSEKEAIARAVADWYGARVTSERPPRPEESGHTRAWLKVSEGCNNRCSFCIVPRMRGPEKSVPLGALVRRAQGMAEMGYQEAVLTGTNIGQYGRDADSSLAELLRCLRREVPSMPRWRVASIEPIDFRDDLVAELAEPAVCPHVHLCLQSGSTAVLNRMRRRYNAPHYLRLVERLRAARPDLAITTDVIVGFPGETEEDFLETCQVVEEVGFAGVHLFPFSVREGTAAELLADRVASAVIAERMERLQAIADRTRRRWEDTFLGEEVEALTERGTGAWRPASTPHGLRLWLDGAETEPNQRWRVRVRREDERLVGDRLSRVARTR